MSEVKEVLAELEQNESSGRFNAKKFEKLLTALINDQEFTFKTVKSARGEIEEIVELNVSKEVREFLKTILEKFGVDKKESERVLSEDFKITNAKGLYNFVAVAIYLYIKSGNKFKFLTTEDFKGSLKLEEVEEKEKIRKDVRHPQTREILGDYKTTTGKHYELRVKSTAPEWLKKRVKIES